MSKLNQKGLIPLIFLILIGIIASASFLVIKNIPFNEAQPYPSLGFQGSISALLKPKQTKTPSSKPIATFSPSPKPNTSSTPSQQSPTPSTTSSPSSNTTVTASPTASSPTPTPTTTPSPTPSGPNATGGITVIYPNGGETISYNSPLTIRWSAPTLNKVVIRLLKNGNHFLDISNPNDPYVLKDNTGSYTWTPSVQIGSNFIGSGFRITVEGYTADAPNTLNGPDQSDGEFTISQ